MLKEELELQLDDAEDKIMELQVQLANLATVCVEYAVKAGAVHDTPHARYMYLRNVILRSL